MNILGLKINEGTEHIFATDEAVKEYGDIEALNEKLEQVQRDHMTRGYNDVKLVMVKGYSDLVIRLITAKTVSRDDAIRFMCENGVPVS